MNLKFTEEELFNIGIFFHNGSTNDKDDVLSFLRVMRKAEISTLQEHQDVLKRIETNADFGLILEDVTKIFDRKIPKKLRERILGDGI